MEESHSGATEGYGGMSCLQGVPREILVSSQKSNIPLPSEKRKHMVEKLTQVFTLEIVSNMLVTRTDEVCFID